MGVNGLLSNREGDMNLKEYEIKVLPINSKDTQLIKMLSVPRICSNIKIQDLNCY